MRIRVLLASVLLCILQLLPTSSLFAQRRRTEGREKSETRIETKATSPDIGDEKAPQLLPTPKTNHLLELRPTYSPLSKRWHTENVVEFGYRSSEDRKFSYVQYFNTALYTPRNRKTLFDDPKFSLQPGFFRFRFNNLWRNEDKSWIFSIQERIYVPVDSANNGYPSKLNQGMIFVSRTYFTLRKKFFSFLEADIAIVPTIPIYSKNGYQTSHHDHANPFYETLIEQSTDFKIGDDILLTVPISFRMTRNRNYSDRAHQNGGWAYNLTLLPELYWSLTENHSIGGAFVTDNMLSPNGAEFNSRAAFRNGVVQLLWNMKF